MTRYLVRRLLQLVPLLIGISFIVFALINIVPGSPTDQFQFNSRVTPEDVQRINATLGLDRPWYERYFVWLGNALQGDFGYSFINGSPVTYRIGAALPNTLLLTTTALVFALVIAVPLGIITAVKRNSWFDHVFTVLSTAAYSLPTLWVGLMLIILTVNLGKWGLPTLPTGGTVDLRGEGGFLDRMQHLILPAFTLGIVQLAGWARYIRSSMLEVVRQDYVRTAEAKGLNERVVLWGHAFRNALLPLVTLVGLTLPELFGGAVIVEEVFGWNGIGRLTVNALQQNDYSIAMGTVMMLALLTVVGNLLADVAYGIMDPRVRYD